MSLKIIVRGEPNTGKTTAARLIQLALEEAGYVDVHVHDLPAVRHGKGEFAARWERNKQAPVEIVVEVEEKPKDPLHCRVCGVPCFGGICTKHKGERP